jgi:hypothetical protein
MHLLHDFSGVFSTVPIFRFVNLAQIFAKVLSVLRFVANLSQTLDYLSSSEEQSLATRDLMAHFATHLLNILSGLNFPACWLCRLVLSHRNGQNTTSLQLAVKEVLTTV